MCVFLFPSAICLKSKTNIQTENKQTKTNKKQKNKNAWSEKHVSTIVQDENINGGFYLVPHHALVMERKFPEIHNTKDDVSMMYDCVLKLWTKRVA